MTSRREIDELLAAVAEHRIEPAAAADALAGLPFRDLGFARVDTHRELRQGAPEVVLGEGKTLRVCHLGETGRVELAAGDLVRASTPAERAAIVRAGYDDTQIDPEPFRSGSLNRLRTPLPLFAT